MKKYKVTFECHPILTCGVEVEADNPDHALELADTLVFEQREAEWEEEDRDYAPPTVEEIKE